MAKARTVVKMARKTTPAPQDSTEAKIFFRYFDQEFYARQLPDDLRATNLAEHYLKFGWKLGLDPSPDFSTADYLDDYSDVREAGMNPLEHFARFGLREGRQPQMARGHSAAAQDHDYAPGYDAPSDVVSDAPDYAFSETTMDTQEYEFTNSPAPDSEALADTPDHAVEDAAKAAELAYIISVIRGQMEMPYYRYQLTATTLSGDDELARHYIEEGWQEGLDPSVHFSTRYYLEANPDVAQAGVNPFYHYVVAGRNEGRLPRHPGGDAVTRLRHIQPLETLVDHWRHEVKPAANLTASAITARLRKGTASLLVAFTHDNYKANSGGVQLCVQLEEDTAAKNAIQYLAVFPAAPIPRLVHRDETRDNLVKIVLAGEQLGCCRMSDLIKAVDGARTKVKDVAIIIHHFLGHTPEQIAKLATTAKARSCAIWVHDYFSLCPSFALQRNSVSYCGAPPVTSNECTLCLYGPERSAHLQRLEKFFKAVPVDVLSPSKVALDLWSARSSLPTRSKSVVSHMSLAWKPRPKPVKMDPKAPVRVAFIGTISPIKGWPAFAELVRQFSLKGGYEFICFGLQPPPAANVRTVPVHVTATDRGAMIKAIAKEDIDIVLHWAGWPETFSFSTYESIAGGAFVITNPQSGNVAVAVKALDSGAVLENEEQLIDFFAKGKAKAMAKRARKRRGGNRCTTALSKMSLPHFYGSVK